MPRKPLSQQKPTTLEQAREKQRALLRQLKESEAQEQTYREENRIQFFEPIEPYQTKILEYLHARKRTITLQGANQIGKTVIGACITGSACLGIQPWDGRETVWGRRPVKVRVICKDWEHHAGEVIVPEMKRWFPIGQYETKKNNVGIEAFWHFKSGSTIELMTHIQDTGIHEGWKGDLVWADEPLPRDKYVANQRGLIAQGGIFLLTMTAVSESWILDEIVLNSDPSFASITEVPISANPYLTEENIRVFASTLREDEKVARVEGKWLNLVGLVWKGFNPDLHLVNGFDVPTDWPVLAMIDFHPAKPQAISFYAVDPQDRIFVIDEKWAHLSPEETADMIIRAKSANVWRIEEAYIDPLSKGDVAYMKNRHGEELDAFSIIKGRLERHGIDLQVASKDKTSGILNVEKLLMGPNRMPTLFFFRTLNKIEKEGIVWEIQRWTYDENQEPRKENDHFAENLYRMTLTGLKYRPMRDRHISLTSETEFDPFAPNYGIQDDWGV